MISLREQLLFISAGCMSLLWRFAFTTTLAASLYIVPVPFWSAMLCIALGVLSCAITNDKNWRVIQSLLFHVVGFGSVMLITLHFAFDGPSYLPNIVWLEGLLTMQKTPLQWFELVYFFSSSLWFWACGCVLISRPRSHKNICQRFDAGTAGFFGIFLFRFYLDRQHGFVINEPLSGALFIPFFLMSIMGLALAGNCSSARKEFIPGYKGVGIILSFGLAVLGLVAAAVSFFQPVLKSGAEAGYGAVKSTIEPLGPYVINVILFLFAPRKTYQASQAEQQTDQAAPIVLQQESWLSDSAQEIISYIFIGLQGVLLIIALLFIGWLLSRWLFSRAPEESRNGDSGRIQISFLAFIIQVFFLLQQVVKRLFPKRNPGADELYFSLLSWGQYSGVCLLAGETPHEYGCRLQYHFPELGDEIQHIINAFNRKVYGVNHISSSELLLAQKAWRNMRSSRYWKMRLKMVIFGYT